MAKTCYFCGEPATTREHLPGRAFYPEQKDLPPGSPNVCENMLTVPACAEHNNAQSMDDQYAAYTIVTSLDNNALSRSHIAGKVLRAIKRTPHIFETLMPEARPVLFDGQESVAFKMDRARMSSVMERIARGLYFHHTGERLVIPLDWISPDMLNLEKGFHEGAERASHRFDRLRNRSERGHHDHGGWLARCAYAAGELETAESQVTRLREQLKRGTADLRESLERAQEELEGRDLEVAALQEKVRALEMMTRNALTNETIEKQFDRIKDQARRVEELRSRRKWSQDERKAWGKPPAPEGPDH